MAQTFATNATEALVGADVGTGAGADAVTDPGAVAGTVAGTDAVEEAGLKGSHKFSWQQATSQLVSCPLSFAKMHTAKKNQKCIRMIISFAMQRQQKRTNIIVSPKPRTYMRTLTPEKRKRKLFSPSFF